MKRVEKEAGKNKSKSTSNLRTGSLFLDKELRKKIYTSRVRLMSRIFEFIDWFAFLLFFYFFVNLYSFRWNPAFFLVIILALSQSLFFHRLIFRRLSEKKPYHALSVDICFFLLIILFMAQLGGGVASPLLFIYLLVIGVSAFLFSPYFVFAFLLLEYLIIFLSVLFDPIQSNFINSFYYLFVWEVAILSISAILFFILGYIYSKRRIELEKLQDFYNQLTAEKVKSEAVLESMSDGVFVVDKEKRLVFLNEATEKIIKITKEQKANMLGHFYGSVFKLKIDNKDLDYAKDCPIQLAMTEGKPNFRKDLNVLTFYKKPVFVTLSAAPVIDAAGDIQGAVVVMRDITKEKEVERIQMEFVSVASHELLTPITQVQGHLSMIVDENIGKLDDTATKIVGNAYQGIKRISRLVKDLMNVSRIEKGTLKINPSEIEIDKFIENIVKDFQVEAQSNGLNIVFKKSKRNVSPVFTDSDRLSEVLNNLIVNAIKFTKKGGVTLAVSEKQDNTVVVSVADTGIGISKENIPKLFEKFYQVDSSATREAQGTGLGLYISRMIIEMMGGKIWVESKLGEGSTFNFSLPQDKVQAVDSNKKETSNKTKNNRNQRK